MNIRFKHITAKNFLSFKNLDFNIDRFSNSTVLITGYNDDIQGDSSKQNGAGKSTLNNAILFAIYGEVLNPLKKSTSIRNWSADTTTKDDVEVTLTLENCGNEYAIQRLLKGKKCSGELHVFRRNAEEGPEWNEITLSTMAETQRMIETDIVPCGKDAFLRCVILTADQNKNFFKMNKAEKNSFFEGLFGLTKFSDMYAKLHRMTLDETTSLTASSKSIDKFNENISKLEHDRDEAKKNQNDILKAESELQSFRNKLEEFEKELRECNPSDTMKEEYLDFKKNEISSMKDRMNSFDRENGIVEVDGNHRIVFDIGTDERTVAKKMTEYDESHKLNVSHDGKIIFGNEDGLSELEEEYLMTSKRIKNGKDAVKSVNSDIRSLSAKISECKSEISTIRSSVCNMRKTLVSHSHITDILCSDCLPKYMDSVDISKYPSMIEKYESELPEKENGVASLERELGEKEKLIGKYESKIESLTSKYDELRDCISNKTNERNKKQLDRDSFFNGISESISSTHEALQSKRDNIRNSMITEFRTKCSEYESKISRCELETKAARDEIIRNIKNSEYKLKVLSDSKTEGFDASIKSLTESLESEKTEFDSINETISHYKALEEILKPENIRKSVVPDMLKELNFRICGYLAKMGSNYTCSFDEDFDATFVSNSGSEAEYNNFSSGEKMRLSIACCLAFRDFMQVRLNFHPNMLVIDEFIDSNLDEMAVTGIMDMIHFMVGTERISAFIISHRTEIKQSVFDHEILIRKKNDDSKVIVDGIEE